jgi:hypothetical protein
LFRCYVRYSAGYYLLALTVVGAGPLLGCTGQVRAGFVTPGGFYHLSGAADSLAVGQPSSGWSDGGVSLAPNDESSVPVSGSPIPIAYQRRNVLMIAYMPGVYSHSGGTAGTPSGGAGPGGGTACGVVGSVVLPRPCKAGVLQLVDEARGPPPRAVRFFRPPRFC